MLRFPEGIRKSMRQNQLAFLLSGVIAILLLGALPAEAQVVATYSFEDGTTQGWTSFNGATNLAATNVAGYASSYSLQTTTGSNGQGGPSIDVSGLLQAGAKYTITGYVRLASGETATNANFTIRRSDPSCNGGTCYDTIGTYQVPVSDSGWAAIGGSYTVSTTETGMTLYAQLVGPTTAQTFYLDDVVITETAPPPTGNTVAQYTWSDGGLDGWGPFGQVSLQSAVPPLQDPAGDANALLTTGRSAGYMGPSLDLLSLKLAAGATYQVTAYVLLAQGTADTPTVTFSTKTADCATSGSYANVATSAALSTAAWTKVQGTFSFSDLPGPPTSLVLYAQSSSATDSFYISDVTISEVAPPPPNPSQQDNTGITTTFEDGGVDGWSSRSGSSSVTNASGVGHSSNNSLLTTGRIANWDGPQISVSDKMYPGSVYNISGWVMLTPTDGSSHTINVSLQTTLDGNTTYPGVSSYPGITVPADGAWHQISVNGYNMSSAYDPGKASLYFQTVPSSGNDLVSFYLDDFQLTYVSPPQIQTDIPSIYKTLSQYFPVGAAVDMTDVSGPHAQLLTMHFNSIVSGNDMKWSSVESTKGSYNYSNADAEVGEAVCSGTRIRGHNLVWASGAQTPAYATGDGTNSTANQALVTANIQEHIQNEVQHFGNKVYAWDVVNEPLDPNQPDCLLHGPFYKVLGPSYLDVALQAARQYAPPGTKLFINDYSTTDPNRLACLVKVIGDLKARGVPIDAVGHEMHNAINYPSVPAMVNAINTVANAFPDIEQQVTELDMSVYNAGDTKSNYGNNVPPAVLAEQGWLYKAYFDAFRDLAGKLSSVTLWGMADDDTWLDGFPVARTDYPLPFDHGLQAKPAYWGIVDPSKLPGYGLTFKSTITAGTRDTRTVTLTATNGSAGPAYATQINAFTLTQVSGPACPVKVTAPGAFPIALGDIPANGTASAKFTLSLTANCNPNAQWTITAPWSANTYETGTFTLTTNFNRGK
jgi:endo-1,4-beta-xylanase